MRRRLGPLVILASLAATALSVPAFAAQEEKPAPAPPTSTAGLDTCTNLKRSFGALAKAGKTTAYCIGGAKAVTTSVAGPSGSISVLQTAICDQSLGLPPNTWPLDRDETCSSYGDDIYAYDVNNGQTIGYMEVRHQAYYHTNLDQANFGLSFFAKITRLVGRGFEDTQIGGRFNCHAPTGLGCFTYPSEAPVQSFNSLGATWSVATRFDAGIHLQGDIQHLGGWLEWAVFSAGGDPARRAEATAVPPHVVQCDWATPETTNPGCVLDDFVPIFEVWWDRYPSFHMHIEAAQHAGLPGRLTRLTDQDRRTRNGDLACPRGARGYPRPPGYQCDEYPFRSTMEGAAEMRLRDPSIIGMTHSWCQIDQLPQDFSGAGWSSCMIAEGENWLGGVDLGQFYARNRMIDFDQFDVVLMG